MWTAARRPSPGSGTRLRHRCGCLGGFLGRGTARLVAAEVEPEWWVTVGHQRGVPGDPQCPAVNSDDDVEQWTRVGTGERQDDRGDQDEQAGQAAAPGPTAVAELPGEPGPAAEQNRED